MQGMVLSTAGRGALLSEGMLDRCSPEWPRGSRGVGKVPTKVGPAGNINPEEGDYFVLQRSWHVFLLYLNFRLEPCYGYRGRGGHKQGCQGALQLFSPIGGRLQLRRPGPEPQQRQKGPKLSPGQGTETGIMKLNLPHQSGAAVKTGLIPGIWGLDQWTKMKGTVREEKGA